MTLIFHNGQLLFSGGLLAMSTACCCGGCCSRLPEHLYAHVTFNCRTGSTKNVIDMTEAAYTGACITSVGGDAIRIWEGSGSVNGGRGTLLVRFSCASSTGGANYYVCTDGCFLPGLACTDCPATGWTLLASTTDCASGTLGTYTATPAPSGCGMCMGPPAPSMVIVFKTTP